MFHVSLIFLRIAGIRTLAVFTTLGLCATQHPALAQTFPGAKEWAEAIVENAEHQRKWAGPRTPWPVEKPRPIGFFRVSSSLAPVSVHAPYGTSQSHIEHALDALESAYMQTRAAGWPVPFPDGARGGNSDFDLYLHPNAHPLGAAHSDGPIDWFLLDAVSSFAEVRPTSSRSEACIVSAYVQGVLLQQDPAESEAWRRATGDYLAWRTTGAYGCEGSALEQQTEPYRSWIQGSYGEGAGGALMLSLLSARFDLGDGTLVRELWQLARQHTWEGAGLRASPDLWEALEQMVKMHSQSLSEVLERLAIDRFLLGYDKQERPLRDIVGGLPPVPVAWTTEWNALPAHAPPATPAIGPGGSYYAWVDVRGAPRDR
ncbi:MAG: hypothetical protein AAF550_15080, partial [Myxococcota bacterium]